MLDRGKQQAVEASEMSEEGVTTVSEADQSMLAPRAYLVPCAHLDMGALRVIGPTDVLDSTWLAHLVAGGFSRLPSSRLVSPRLTVLGRDAAE